MNKKLFVTVKDLCKDTGLSEKYLKAITEKMGGSIEDDSTDDAAIETTANLIADIAKESQGEATRWANKKKDPKQEPDPKPDPEPDPKPDPTKGGDDALAKRLADVEKELADLKSEKAKGERAKSITELMGKHKIPNHLQARLAKSIGDDEDAEEVIKEYKQGLITSGLETDEPKGAKAASEKQVQEAADDLLKSIEVKQ